MRKVVCCPCCVSRHSFFVSLLPFPWENYEGDLMFIGNYSGGPCPLPKFVYQNHNVSELRSISIFALLGPLAELASAFKLFCLLAEESTVLSSHLKMELQLTSGTF
jgi:hypothetical protein